jgi:RimJ/RimL family protein N-acetyltransferase
MQIRDSDEVDAEHLAALIDGVARERRYLAGTVGFSAESTRAFIASVKAAGGVQFVAEEAGELIGWCDIMPHPFEGMEHAGRLGMGVRKDHRSRGVGRELLSIAIQKAFGGKMERVELEVFASNLPAITLYESVGFVLEGRKIGARRLDGATDDLLLYAKRKCS